MGELRAVTLEIRVGEDPMAGWLDDGAAREPFHGWLELAAMLEEQRSLASPGVTGWIGRSGDLR